MPISAARICAACAWRAAISAYANLTDADLRDADLTDVDLTGAKLPMQFAEICLNFSCPLRPSLQALAPSAFTRASVRDQASR